MNQNRDSWNRANKIALAGVVVTLLIGLLSLPKIQCHLGAALLK